MSEDHSRHLKVMLDDLDRYTAGRLELSDLINGLEAQGRELTPPLDEESEFWQLWYVLEDVYADALERDANDWSLSEQERDLISRVSTIQTTSSG